jgi:lysophospholipase L1-like esterase
VAKKLDIARFAFASIVLLVGIAGSGLLENASYRWTLLAILIFGAPLATQFSRHSIVRTHGLWFGVFLVTQYMISPLMINDIEYFKTLPSNLDVTVNVIGNAIPGIHGLQHITTDAKGFRVTPPIDYGTKRGLRIFAIGGSTTEQIYLDDKATWTYLIQTKLARALGRPVEVINAGVSGLRAVHHVSTLGHIVRYDADVVLFMLGANDWNWQIRAHFATPARHRADPFSKTLLGRALHRLYDIYNRLEPSSDFLVSREERGEYLSRQNDSLHRKDRRTFMPTDVSEDYEVNLRAIDKICKNQLLDCIFLTQPNGYSEGAPDEFKKRFWMTPPNAEFTLDLQSMAHIGRLYNQYLVEFGSTNNYLVIDVASEMRESFDSFYDDMHFNKKGAERVAEIVANALAEHLAKLLAAKASDGGAWPETERGTSYLLTWPVRPSPWPTRGRCC